MSEAAAVQATTAGAFGPVDHVVWDWNGTLVNDTWLCLEILNGFLAERGLPAETLAGYRARFTFPLVRYYEALGFDLEREDFDALSVAYHQRYNARRFECHLHAGAAALLRALAAAGRPQHVLSAYREPDLREALAHYGIDGHLSEVVGLGDYRGAGKAAQGQALAATLGGPPERILLIGDTVHDAEVAQAMGAQCLLVAAGHHPVERLAPTGAPVVAGLLPLPSSLGLALNLPSA